MSRRAESYIGGHTIINPRLEHWKKINKRKKERSWRKRMKQLRAKKSNPRLKP